MSNTQLVIPQDCVFVDVDGVLVDTYTRFAEFLLTRYQFDVHRPDFHPSQIPNTAFTLFFNDASLQTYEPAEGSVRALREIKRMGLRIGYCSGRTDEGVRHVTLEHVVKNKLPVDEISFPNPTDHRTKIARILPLGGCMLIDDELRYHLYGDPSDNIIRVLFQLVPTCPISRARTAWTLSRMSLDGIPDHITTSFHWDNIPELVEKHVGNKKLARPDHNGRLFDY